MLAGVGGTGGDGAGVVGLGRGVKVEDCVGRMGLERREVL